MFTCIGMKLINYFSINHLSLPHLIIIVLQVDGNDAGETKDIAHRSVEASK